MSLNVLEVRNYLLQPGMREHFIDYFEYNFISTLEAANMHILGQFRLLGEPDHYVWLRGYDNMHIRGEALHTFYDGPIWRQHRSRTNGMLIDSDNVHLLRPLDDMSTLTVGQNSRTIAAQMADASISPHTGMIAIDIYQAQAGQRETLIDRFQAQVAPAYKDAGIQVRGRFVAEMGENTFPRHPAFQNEDEFVVITAYESEARGHQQRSSLASIVHHALTPLLGSPPEILLLTPTLRSPLRYIG